ncbi:MAG: cupin domain-containing protein [Candidatus Brocadiia bacterium]
MQIRVEKLTPEQISARGIKTWPIWTKERSKFDWHYDSVEECLILAGHIIVTPKGGSPVEIRAGDFVTFPSGMDCTWEVLVPVRKHYDFK